MASKIVTANRLIDGIVVYFTSDDTWSHRIADARVCTDERAVLESLKLAHDSVANNEVIDAYLIEVILEANSIKPVRYRETIRAEGPSHSTSLSIIAATNSAASLTLVDGI